MVCHCWEFKFLKKCKKLRRRLFVRGFLVYFIVSALLLMFIGSWRISLFHAGNSFVGTGLEHFAKVTFGEMSLLSLYVAFYLSVLASFLDVFVFRTYFKRFSFGVYMLLSVVIEVIVVWVILYYSNMFFVSYVFELKEGVSVNLGDIPDISFISIYLLLIVALCHFLLEIDQKLGRGNLWKFVTGRFYKPRTENRIFMFLDLRGSTNIAEQIGHLNFSRLLQDCFNDLAVVDPYYAKVYQYVGDEVVISWNAERGIAKNNFIHAFFAFQKRLKSKAEFYKTSYGFVPEFKAGVHIGAVSYTHLTLPTIYSV